MWINLEHHQPQQLTRELSGEEWLVPLQQPMDLEIVGFEVVWRHQFQITNTHTPDENDYPSTTCASQGRGGGGNVPPPNDIFSPFDFSCKIGVINHILIRLSKSINSCFRPLYRQCKRIHDNKCITLNFTLHQSHNLDIPT